MLICDAICCHDEEGDFEKKPASVTIGDDEITPTVSSSCADTSHHDNDNDNDDEARGSVYKALPGSRYSVHNPLHGKASASGALQPHSDSRESREDVYNPLDDKTSASGALQSHSDSRESREDIKHERSTQITSASMMTSASEKMKHELKDILLKFIPAARSGIPVTIPVIDGASSFKARVTLVLNEGMDSVTLNLAQKSQETLRQKVELPKIHVFDYDRLKELRPQNNVVKMLAPEDHGRAVLLVSKEGTTCMITEDDDMKIQMIKSLQVLSARATKYSKDHRHTVRDYFFPEPPRSDQDLLRLPSSAASEDLTSHVVTSLSMTLNVDYQQLSADDKDELKVKLQNSFAKSAGVDPCAVSVTLTPGSVKVDVQIRTADINSAESMAKSMKETIIAEFMKSMVVSIASSIPGVKAAATAELKVENLDVKTITSRLTDLTPGTLQVSREIMNLWGPNVTTDNATTNPTAAQSEQVVLSLPTSAAHEDLASDMAENATTKSVPRATSQSRFDLTPGTLQTSREIMNLWGPKV